VLDAGSFSAAGKRLGYTTSAVSQQIAALERSLGVQLFERGPRNLWPTHAARQVGKVAGDVLLRLDELQSEVQAAARVDHGRLRVCGFPAAGARLLPRALAQLTTQFPMANYTLSEEIIPANVAEAVDTARADLGLVYEYDVVPEVWPDTLAIHPILHEQIVVLSGAERRRPLSPRVTLKSLEDELWVANKTDVRGRASFEHWCMQTGFRPKVRFETDNVDVMRGIVREGLGLAFVPALALGVDRSITLHRLDDVAPQRLGLAVHRIADTNPLIGPALHAVRESAEEFVQWTTSGFQTDAERTPLGRIPGA
jgi:DNA-binding transcriptional LysR family regulator